MKVVSTNWYIVILYNMKMKNKKKDIQESVDELEIVTSSDGFLVYFWRRSDAVTKMNKYL